MIWVLLLRDERHTLQECAGMPLEKRQQTDPYLVPKLAGES